MTFREIKQRLDTFDEGLLDQEAYFLEINELIVYDCNIVHTREDMAASEYGIELSDGSDILVPSGGFYFSNGD